MWFVFCMLCIQWLGLCKLLEREKTFFFLTTQVFGPAYAHLNSSYDTYSNLLIVASMTMLLGLAAFYFLLQFTIYMALFIVAGGFLIFW